MLQKNDKEEARSSIPNKKIYISVNSASRIPSGIFFLFIIGNHHNLIILSILQILIKNNIDVRETWGCPSIPAELRLCRTPFSQG